MKIIRQHLRVPELKHLDDFYTGIMGMHSFGSPQSPCFGYDTHQCLLAFSQNPDVTSANSENDFYWKTGITVINLEHAVDYLRSSGYSVSEPRQFRDIGYLCHITDPFGLQIELLQQGFEGNAKHASSGHPVGSQATIAHITLRVTNILKARQYFEHVLKMRLMSIQPVPEREFTLYFFAWSEERLPNSDLESPSNREWLWARPYALIELKHVQSKNVSIRWPDNERSRFAGFSWQDDGGVGDNLVRLNELVNSLR